MELDKFANDMANCFYNLRERFLLKSYIKPLKLKSILYLHVINNITISGGFNGGHKGFNGGHKGKVY